MRRAKGSAVTANLEAIPKQLRNVYWLGGASAAGKSTMAHRLAVAHGFQPYATDDVMPEHAQRSTSENCPLLHDFMAMDIDKRWVNRSPKVMLETFHWFRGEGFDMIVEDLANLPQQPAVVADGFRLLPRLVKPLLAESHRALWLIPTPEFRETVIQRRGGSQWGFLARTSDPQRALRNLLQRDAMFTQRLEQETRRLGLTTIAVTPNITEDEMAARVADAFRL